MKRLFEPFLSKSRLWTFIGGLAIGFALGMMTLEALVPGSTELIRMYRLDKQSLSEDRAALKEDKANFQGSLEVDVR